jgi:hypothetical protein
MHPMQTLDAWGEHRKCTWSGYLHSLCCLGGQLDPCGTMPARDAPAQSWTPTSMHGSLDMLTADGGVAP